MKFKRMTSLLLTLVFLFSSLAPLWAGEEEPLKTKLTLQEIQKIAREKSRTIAENQLRVDSGDRQKRIAKREKRRLQRGSSIGLSDQLKVLQTSKNQILEQLGSLPDPTSPSYLILQAQLMGLESQIAAVGSQKPSISSGIKQFRQMEEQAEDALEDLLKMQKDHEEELDILMASLVCNALNLEKVLANLEDARALNMDLINFHEKKKEIGLGLDIDVQKQRIATGDLDKTILFTKEQYELILHQINDFLARDITTPLELVEVQVAESTIPAPSYQALEEEVLEKNYDLKRIKREIDRLEDENDDTDGSNEKEIARNNIALKELEEERTLVSVRDNLKRTLASYVEKEKAYNLAILDLRRAEKDYAFEQAKQKLGMVSPLSFRASELDYNNAYQKKISTAYDYYLVRQELFYLKDGINLSYYQAIK